MSDLADVVIRDPFETAQRFDIQSSPIYSALSLIYQEQGWNAQSGLLMIVNPASRPMNVIGSTKDVCGLCKEAVWISPSSRRETAVTLKLCMPCIEAAHVRATAKGGQDE